MTKILKDFMTDFACEYIKDEEVDLIPTDFTNVYFNPMCGDIFINNSGNTENYPLLSKYLSPSTIEELESIGEEAHELYNEHIIGIEENDDKMDIEIIIEDYNDRIRDFSDGCLEIILGELEAQKDKLEDWFFAS
ncbi:hypothetical protein [Dysgonomonas capnocytophagoides]|uniref:hypothetical protein n=1 Tax=Dysgonomonas capnocytophagoides TaxID=45254 RepID=UPI003993777A